MAKIRIKQVHSGIGGTPRQKDTLRALGFTKVHQVLEKEATPQVKGMVAKVAHLLKVEEI